MNCVLIRDEEHKDNVRVYPKITLDGSKRMEELGARAITLYTVGEGLCDCEETRAGLTELLAYLLEYSDLVTSRRRKEILYDEFQLMRVLSTIVDEYVG